MKKNFFKLFLTVVLSMTTIFCYVNINDNTKKVKANSKIYNVPIQLWHSENSGRLSMGNAAVSSLARVEEYSGGSTITVQFVPMQFMNMNGHLYSLSVYSTALFGGGLTQANVISFYQDTDLDGNIANFPSLLQFSRNAQKEDKIGVKVSVDAMDKIMGGDASQNAILKFNWSAAQLISGYEEEATTNNSEPAQTDVNNEKEENNSAVENKEEKSQEEEKNSDDNNKENNSKKEVPLKKVEDFFKEDKKTKEVGVYNIDITASYLNPLTGITADGGTKNVEIGEGMSQGVISPVNTNFSDLQGALANQKTSGEKRWSKAQLQRTKDGKLYATVRIHLINWITRSKEQGPFIKVLQKNGEYVLVEAKEVNVHIEQFKDSFADYTFEVPKENFSAMIQMFVEPMNRPVRFFVEVNPETISKGQVDGMKIIEEKNNDYKKYIYYLLPIFVFILIFGIYKKIKKSKLEDNN